MALETLKNIHSINGELVAQKEDGFDDVKSYISQEKHIIVDHIQNVVAFRIQNGPIKEVGKNGCQVTDVIAVAKRILEELNKKFPCRENAMTITHLDEALLWQIKRTMDRQNRGVEGHSKE